MRTRRGFARFSLLAGVSAFAVTVLAFPATQHARQPARDPGFAEILLYYPEIMGQPRAQVIDCGPGCSEYRYVDYRGKMLRGILRGVTFTGCDFRGADLRQVDFTDCVFSGCDLRSTRLDGAKSHGVFYSSDTKRPAGFDPEPHGARLDE